MEKTTVVSFDPFKHVCLSDIAHRAGRDRSTVSRLCERLGIVQLRRSKAKNSVRYVTKDDADRIERSIKTDTLIKPTVEDAGYPGIYAVLVPAYDGAPRLKIGKSNNVGRRLSDYRTLVPDLVVCAVWLTSEIDQFEFIALKFARNTESSLSAELFEGDIEHLVKSIDNIFFSLGVYQAVGV